MYDKVKRFTATGVVFDKMGQVLFVKHIKFGWLPPGGM